MTVGYGLKATEHRQRTGALISAGAYFFVGQGGAFCHHPDYRFDTGIIPVGAAILIDLVLGATAETRG